MPLQLIRLPTTVDQTNCTGAVLFSPVALKATLEFTGPDVDARSALIAGSVARLAESVVTSLNVGATWTARRPEAPDARCPSSR